MERKIAGLSIVLYILYYLFAPTPYAIAGSQGVAKGVEMLHYFVPLLLLTPLYNGRIIDIASPYCNRHIWLKMCIVVMFCCIILTFTPLHGWWWSWKTVGLLFATIAAVLLSTEKTLKDVGSLYLSAGIILLFVGVWEIFYNTGVLTKHNFFEPEFQGQIHWNYVIIIIMNLFWVITGGGIIAYVRKSVPNALKLTIALPLLVSVFVALMLTWISIGMPLATYWIDGEGPFYGTINYWRWLLVHGSKVALIAALISLTWKPETLKGYVYIPIWVGGFIATSALLAINIIVAKFRKGTMNPPYFKQRSIFVGEDVSE